MSHPLNGSWARVARATEHFEELEAKIGNPADQTASIAFVSEFNPDASTIKITLEDVPELPVEWALLASDALQNLRAALNYLTWELARWSLAARGETREPIDATQFPINTKPRQFSRYMVADLHPDHAAIIESLQPNGAIYLSNFSEADLQILNVETLAARSALGILARLTNTDKHRTLQLALIDPASTTILAPEVIDCVVTHTYYTPNLTLENGAEWFTFDVTPTGPKPEVKVNIDITPRIQVAGWSMESVDWLVGQIAAIIETLEPVF